MFKRYFKAIKNNIIGRQKSEISKKIKERKYKEKSLQIEITEYESLKSNTEIQYSREKYKRNKMREIEKGNSLNTHEKYNMYVSKLKYSISNIEQNLDALIKTKF